MVLLCPFGIHFFSCPLASLAQRNCSALDLTDLRANGFSTASQWLHMSQWLRNVTKQVKAGESKNIFARFFTVLFKLQQMKRSWCFVVHACLRVCSTWKGKRQATWTNRSNSWCCCYLQSATCIDCNDAILQGLHFPAVLPTHWHFLLRLGQHEHKDNMNTKTQKDQSSN